MTKLNTDRILVPVDFSETSKRALRHAAAVAVATGGELHLLYVRKKNKPMELATTLTDLRNVASESVPYRDVLEHTAREVRDANGIRVKTLVAVGNAITEIGKVVKKKNIGLVVMGTEGADSDSSLFFGSNSQRVVFRSQVPVMTVRKAARRVGYECILLPVDTSEHSRQKVNVAIQVARLFSSRIHLLGLLHPSQQDEAGKLEVIMRQVEKRITGERIAVSVEKLITTEPAKATLQSAAMQKADVIIAMTDEKLNNSYFGTRAFDRELVDHAQVPVLSVPPLVDVDNIQQVSFGGL